jgi:acyl-coenzyme A synthetase/AMP-(fatty) acid ligase
MKRAVICVSRPWEVIDHYEKDYSIMVVNPSTTPDRLRYLLDNSDYSVLVSDHGVKTRNGCDYSGEKVYWYTSGTTGDSKFFSFSAEQLDIMSKTICCAYDITANDRYFSVMPLWHGHGQGFYWAMRLIGCEAVYGNIFDQEKIEKLQPTFITSIPDMMKIFMTYNLENLRFVRTASSSLTNNLYDAIKKRWQCPVIEAFGMTEALSHCFTNSLHGEQRIGTVGLPDGIQAELRNQHLWIQGPCTVNRDWVDTGDLAEQDDQGYVKILGRSVDRINVKGYKIDPLSIENQLYNQFEDIKEVAVFGSDRLKCVFVGDVDLHKVSAFLVSLGSACRPRFLQQIDEIPKNTAGKISRSLLEQYFS